MPDPYFLVPALVLLLAGILGAVLLRRVQLSPIIGYFLAGILIGPHGLALVDETDTLHFLAELGVVFLLFDVGLHFSMRRLWESRRELFGFGPVQVGLCGGVLGVASYASGLKLEAALVVGVTLALSSTAVVLQNLMERKEQGSPLGRASIAILIFQDLLTVFLLILVEALGAGGASLWSSLGMAAIKALLAVGIVMVVGRYVLHPAFEWIASVDSEEVFTAMALLVVLATAAATGMAGLSLPLGAFLAGMMISESEYCYMVKAELRPFRGLLLGFFFITVGMALNLNVVVSQTDTLALIVFGMVAVKTLMLVIGARMLGYPNGFALRIGLLLSQGSEFGFVILGLSATLGVLTADVASLLIAAIGISLALTPALEAIGTSLANRLESQQALPAATMSGTRLARVLIAGFGTTGRTVARALDAADIDYVALEGDRDRFARARCEGFNVSFGNPAQLSLLDAAGAGNAHALVIALDDARETRTVQTSLSQRYPQLPLFSRQPPDAQVEPLESGDDSRNEQQSTASLLAAEILRYCKIEETRIQRWLDEQQSESEIGSAPLATGPTVA